MILKAADGVTNSVDHDQTAPDMDCFHGPTRPSTKIVTVYKVL